MTRPICGTCTRNAQTVDTPNVKVRVTACVIMADGQSGYTMLVRCHGANASIALPPTTTEEGVAAMRVFT